VGSYDAVVGQVTDTFVLFNGTLAPGNLLPNDGAGPVAAAYEPVNGYVYVADLWSNGATNHR
jgi:DNA-binding beta-propeller fold protein YncE